MDKIIAAEAQPGRRYIARGGDPFVVGEIVSEHGARYRRVVSDQGVHTDLPMDYEIWLVEETFDVQAFVGMDRRELEPLLQDMVEEQLLDLAEADTRAWLAAAVEHRIAALQGREPPPVGDQSAPATDSDNEPAAPSQVTDPPLRDPLVDPVEGDTVRALNGREWSVSGRLGDEVSTVHQEGDTPVFTRLPLVVWQAMVHGAEVVCVRQAEIFEEPDIELPPEKVTPPAMPGPGESLDVWDNVGKTASDRVAHMKHAVSTAEVDSWLLAHADPPLQVGVRREGERHTAALGRLTKLIGDPREVKQLEVMLGQPRTAGRPGLAVAIKQRLGQLQLPPIVAGPDFVRDGDTEGGVAKSTESAASANPADPRAELIREGGFVGDIECPYGPGAKRDAWREGRRAHLEGSEAQQGGAPAASNAYAAAAGAVPADAALQELRDAWALGWTEQADADWWSAGHEAQQGGAPVENTPYAAHSRERSQWVSGWIHGWRSTAEGREVDGEVARLLCAGRLAHRDGVALDACSYDDSRRIPWQNGWLEARDAARPDEPTATALPAWDISALPFSERVAASSVACATELIAARNDPDELRAAWVAVAEADDNTELLEAIEGQWEAVTGGSWSTDPKVSQADEPPDAPEVTPATPAPDPPEWTAEIEEAVDRMGAEALAQGRTRDEAPYERDTKWVGAWLAGWDGARRAQLADLIKQWRADPCWDLDDSEVTPPLTDEERAGLKAISADRLEASIAAASSPMKTAEQSRRERLASYLAAWPARAADARALCIRMTLTLDSCLASD